MLLAREVTPDISACLFHLNIRVEGKSLGWLTVTPGSKQLNSISPTIGGSALLKFDGESLHIDTIDPVSKQPQWRIALDQNQQLILNSLDPQQRDATCTEAKFRVCDGPAKIMFRDPDIRPELCQAKASSTDGSIKYAIQTKKTENDVWASMGPLTIFVHPVDLSMGSHDSRYVKVQITEKGEYIGWLQYDSSVGALGVQHGDEGTAIPYDQGTEFLLAESEGPSGSMTVTIDDDKGLTVDANTDAILMQELKDSVKATGWTYVDGQPNEIKLLDYQYIHLCGRIVKGAKNEPSANCKVVRAMLYNTLKVIETKSD